VYLGRKNSIRQIIHVGIFYSAAALLAMQSAVIPTAIPSVRPSVRLSVRLSVCHTLVPYPRGSAVERQSLASVLSPSCARPVADG